MRRKCCNGQHMHANACAAGRLLVVLACTAGAADSATADDHKTSTPQQFSADIFDSKARIWLLKRQAGENALKPNIESKRASAANSIQRLEEIHVYGAIEPEDYVTPKRPRYWRFEPDLSGSVPGLRKRSSRAHFACSDCAQVCRQRWRRSSAPRRALGSRSRRASVVAPCNEPSARRGAHHRNMV